MEKGGVNNYYLKLKLIWLNMLKMIRKVINPSNYVLCQLRKCVSNQSHAHTQMEEMRLNCKYLIENRNDIGI